MAGRSCLQGRMVPKGWLQGNRLLGETLVAPEKQPGLYFAGTGRTCKLAVTLQSPLQPRKA